MLDTRGSGLEYSKEQLSSFEELAELYTNDKRFIFAELLASDDGNKVYLREWLSSQGSGDSCSFCIVNSIDELKEELKKDSDHGDLPPAKINKILDAVRHLF